MNLEDNSGEIEIKLWGNKIDLIKEQGATVTLKELRADIYRYLQQKIFFKLNTINHNRGKIT